ncbi:hypothetical protein TTHERM_00770840 (macronuclear) [Tetrahymena thermophila SB210]|uniref:Uncharacterized protein n=1 Tax=Tetrahymena thermophila (strain SB210) TaxID=312017 RepID=Q23AR1_TETTS|nr:hypothetical protein TTHERM_00770840 [Tetrahymena thermophila SB210]EAR93631.1 hypothetical protein TTHERM_00770840 [Tetrahymena thermophila SB210]|eukprot:XP_001013876.1 hypothetical protein TTHERM_00770840 [Tetrahymena thermophila SB210]
MSSQNLEIFEEQTLKMKIDESLQQHQELNDEEILNRYQKVVKSNSIKTILYHFIDFMKSSGDDIIIEALSKTKDKSISQIRKEFSSFIKQKKLNQQTFLALYNSSRFSAHLEYYLNYYSIDVIILNNMKYYESHILCLVFFQRCFANKELINFIKTYKKNNNQF